MERRCILKAGLVLGATFIGEPLEALAAEVERPLKLKRQFFDGCLCIDDLSYFSVLRMAIVGRRVVGFGAVTGGKSTLPILQLTGSVRKGKLKGVLAMVLDPTEQVKPGTVVGSVTAKVGRKSIKGKLVSRGIPGATPGMNGDVWADLVEEDVPAMREIAGVYDGTVIDGLPGYRAVTTLGANGTYTVDTVRRPDGSAAPGRVGGVYMLEPPYNPGSWDRIVYALPLPSAQNAQRAMEGGGALPGLFDCCFGLGEKDDECVIAAYAVSDSRPNAQRSVYNELKAGEAAQLSAVSIILRAGFAGAGFSYIIQGIRRE